MPVSCLNVSIETVVGEVDLAIWEPSMQVLVGCVKDLRVWLEPVQFLSLLVEVGSRIFNGSSVVGRMRLVHKVIGRTTAIVENVLVRGCLRGKGSDLGGEDRHPTELVVQHCESAGVGSNVLTSHHRKYLVCRYKFLINA